MRPDVLLAELSDLYRDKLALRQRHVAAARLVDDYDYNNTYQYVIAREDAHLAWLRAAIDDLGGTSADGTEAAGLSSSAGTQAAILRDDAVHERAFVARWQPRITSISHARHRRMCEVIVAEAREHLRFFEQAVAGRNDLLGRRPAAAGTGGGVLPVRWIE